MSVLLQKRAQGCPGQLEERSPLAHLFECLQAHVSFPGVSCVKGARTCLGAGAGRGRAVHGRAHHRHRPQVGWLAPRRSLHLCSFLFQCCPGTQAIEGPGDAECTPRSRSAHPATPHPCRNFLMGAPAVAAGGEATLAEGYELLVDAFPPATLMVGRGLFSGPGWGAGQAGAWGAG